MANVADYNVANASGASVRSDINNILQAVVTLNSGTSEPSTMYPFMIWVDTTNNLVKMRNGANDGWLTMPFAMNASDTAPNGLTISGGDLTVDTSTLKVDSTNNRIGVGTASPSNTLSVVGVITSGDFTSVGAGGTPADLNTAEVGRGYINLARDDTADVRQITFGKNGAVHSYLETTSSGLNIGGANVGINTSNPTEALSISSSDGLVSATSTTAKTTGVLTGGYVIYSGDGSGPGAGNRAGIQSYATNSVGSTYDLRFYTSDGSTNFNESMRLDATHLMVGTTESNPTSSSVNTAGQSFSTGGGVRSTVGSNPAATFNRKGDDGDVILFRKNGVTVGSIGTNDPAVYIGSGDVGVRFDGANDRIRPVGNSSNLGAVRDNAIDLGDSAARFKDLYLSGGAYIGGTAAANKLDDYEEGSWTPNWSIGNGSTTGTYVKVGNIVTVTATFTMGSTTTMGTKLEATNLPFSCANMTYSGARYENNAQNSYLGATRATGSQLRAYTVRTDTTEATEQTVSTNEPFTWGEDDYAQLSITYATS